MNQAHIAISGEPGSGTSSVASMISERLRMKLFSTGAVHRQIAADRGETALQTNITAETDESIDRAIDSRSVDLGKQPAPIVFDSRMAWHFVPHAFKVHLVVDPAVAAERIADRSTEVESYGSVMDAAQNARERAFRERSRFASKYGVDVTRMRNYDLVIDTTQVAVDEALELITRRLIADRAARSSPVLYLCPQRVFPVQDRALIALAPSPDSISIATDVERLRISVAYAAPFFYCSGSTHLLALSRAIRLSLAIVPSLLTSEGDEPHSLGNTAALHFKAHYRVSAVRQWETIHGFRFSAYPVLTDTHD